MQKVVKIILIVLSVVAAILWTQLPESQVPYSEAVDNGAMNIMFIIMYVLLAVAVFASLLFSLINLFANPKSIKKTLFVVGGFLLVVAIAYGLSSGDDVSIQEMADRGVQTDETTIKRIGVGLWTFFILVIVAVGAMLWGGIRKMTK